MALLARVLHIAPSEVRRMTPEQTDELERIARRDEQAETELRVELAKASRAVIAL